ncbi:MAG: PD40 domain-containing protein [Deltaproteobacteria bacterium]|nr:MAG: PD40 domain-containing protein [Deltaproteobacteria bacterium]
MVVKEKDGKSFAVKMATLVLAGGLVFGSACAFYGCGEAKNGQVSDTSNSESIIEYEGISGGSVKDIVVAEGYTVEIFAAEVQPPYQQGPNALAFDSQGNLYIAPGDYLKVLKIPVGTNIPEEFSAVRVPDLDGVAVDSQDNIIASGTPYVYKFASDGSVIWRVYCPIGNVQLVAVDSDDNAYVGSLGTRIAKIPPDGSSVTVLGNFSHPSEPAVSPDGFLYISQLEVRNVVMATLDTAEIIEVVATGVRAAQPVFDPEDDLFIGDVLTGRVLKISLPDGTISTIASGFTFPRALAFDADGNLFVGDPTDKIIYKISPAPPAVIEATIDIDPDTLNLKSHGKWITVYVELPEGYDVNDIDISTVLLEDAIPAESHPTEVGDSDGDGIADLMVKFDRTAVEAILRPAGEVELVVTGELNDGTEFEGSDIIRVINKGGPSVDNDGDGFTNLEDCNDGDASIYPGAPELCDSVDNQCPGDDGYGLVDEGCGPSGKIVFQTFAGKDSGQNGIYIMNADGSNVTRLTYYNGDAYPALSPDGSKIAFRASRDGNYEIYVMDVDGSNQTNLTRNITSDGYPAWSPDGSKIAFSSRRDGNYEIHIMNADGSNVTRLTNHPATDRAPSWSPDGNKIVFQSQRDDNDYEIYVMDADGGNVTRLTYNTVFDLHPAWSPDGSKIAFTSERDGNFEIYVMDADGSNVTNLTNCRSWDYEPTWSPDGKYIAFETLRGGDTEIYVMDADGSNQINLTNDPKNNHEPSWSQ